MASTVGKRKGPSGARKYKSGAQKRREKAERDEAEVGAARAKARELGIPIEDEPEADFAADFLAAGEPDLEHPETDLFYVRKLQLIALKQMASTARPSKAQQDFWRRIREMSAVVGMTSPRAALEAEVKNLKGTLEAARAKLGAVKVEPGHGVPRPATARGQRGARGPRPVPGPSPGPTKGEDSGDPPVGGGKVG